MTYAELIDYYGSQVEASRALRLSPPSVWAWKDSTIPYDRQCQIQVETKGALKARRKDDSRQPRVRAA